MEMRVRNVLVLLRGMGVFGSYGEEVDVGFEERLLMQRVKKVNLIPYQAHPFPLPNLFPVAQSS